LVPRLIQVSLLVKPRAARSPTVAPRTIGRAWRSSGDVAASLPLFESAFATASAAGEDFIAIHAAHMAALAARDANGFIA
jgi:hypothetical protein